MGLSRLVLNMAEVARPLLVKLVPAPLLSRAKAKVVNRQAKELEKTDIEPADLTAYPDGINLIGNIRGDTGLGQSMRLVADIINASDIDFMIYNYYVPPGDSMTDKSWDEKISDKLKYNINLIHINPSELSIAFMDIGRQEWDKRYNIGYWLWELEEFPQEWMPAFALLDEIWTPSEFISETLRKYTDKPVYTVPYSVTAPVDDTYDREYFGLPDDRFLFMTAFNSGSGMIRKNPVSVAKSFKKAFPKDNQEVGLVIKINESEQSRQDIELIKKELNGYENVYYICRTLTKVQTNSLINCVDVFVSLHRAEGFGLVLAESMLNRTPVIATNWSANTEFMNSDVACMIDYKMEEIKKDIPPFKKGFRWAQADLDKAAAAMRRLYADKAFYERNADRAYYYVTERLSMDRSRTLMMSRLELIKEECLGTKKK